MLILSSAVPNKTTAKSRPLCPLYPVTKFTLTIIIKDIVSPLRWTHPHHILCQTCLKSDQYHCKNTISNYLQWAAVQYVRYTCLNLHWLLFWKVLPRWVHRSNLLTQPSCLFMIKKFMSLMCTLPGKASHLTVLCACMRYQSASHLPYSQWSMVYWLRICPAKWVTLYNILTQQLEVPDWGLEM